MKKYSLYTDGSDLKHTSRRLGVAGILVDPTTNREIGIYSEELSREDILREYGTSECSNPFAEMVAVLESLIKFSSLLKPSDQLTVYADYQGVQGWLSGKWKAKEPYIIQVRDEILELIEELGIKTKYEWVKGHQPKSIMSPQSFWNGEVDKLARNGTTRSI